MNLKHLLGCLICALLLGVANAPATAAVVVAGGSNGFTHTVTGEVDIETAAKEAVEACSQRDVNCEPLVWRHKPGAVAIAKGDGGPASVAFDDKPEVARDIAIAACKKAHTGCQFIGMFWEPGVHWYARATALDEKSNLVSESFIADKNSRESAEQEALKRCTALQRKQGRTERCTAVSGSGTATYAAGTVTSADGKSSAGLTYFNPGDRDATIKIALAEAKKAYPGMIVKFEKIVVNPGPRPEPRNFKAVVALIEKVKVQQAARPVRAVTRSVDTTSCRNECSNGSCLRIFPDGRTERWEAPRVFDPFTNNWKWDTITNACGQ